MAKRSMQTKVLQLQSHFKGESNEKNVENSNETGDWSPENLAKNRERYYRQNEPWVLEGKTIGQWFDEKIKERNEQLKAA